MQRHVKTSLFVSTIVLAICVSGRHAIARQQHRQISVVGQGVVETMPDQVKVGVRVIDRQASLLDAKRHVDETIGNVFDVCRKLEVDRKHVTASELMISPVFDYEEGGLAVIGYEVSRDVEVLLVELATFSDFVGNALEAGINAINFVAPDSAQRDELMGQARVRAIEDAKAQGRSIAEGFGVVLGELRSASTQTPEWGQTYSLFGAPGEAEFRPGPIKLVAVIHATFEIE